MLATKPTLSEQTATGSHDFGLHSRCVKMHCPSVGTGSVTGSGIVNTGPVKCKPSPAGSLNSSPLTVGQTSSTKNVAGTTALKSSWIQRLKLMTRKPGETELHCTPLELPAAHADSENTKVSLSLPTQGGETECVQERRGPDEDAQEVNGLELVKSSEPVGLLQENGSAKPEASSAEQADDNLKNGSPPEASQKSLDRKVLCGADVQSKVLESGAESVDKKLTENVPDKKLTENVPAAPVKSGFGPWISVSSRSRVEEKAKLELEKARLNSRLASHRPGAGIFSDSLAVTQSCRQVEDRAKGAAGQNSSLNNAVSRSGPTGSCGTRAATIVPASMGKPPLPPPRSGTTTRSNLGLPPRPIIQKVQGLIGRASLTTPLAGGKDMLGRGSEQSIILSPQKPINEDGVLGGKVVGGGVRNFPNEEKMSTLIEDAGATGGAFFNEGRSGKVGSVGEVFPTTDFVSNQQSMPYREAKFRKSAIMAPPSSIPQAARQRQVGNTEAVDGIDATLGRRVGAVNGGQDAINMDTAGLSSEPVFIDLNLKLPRPGSGEPLKSGDLVLPTVVGEQKGNALQQLPLLKANSSFDSVSGSSHGIVSSDRADTGTLEPAPSASSTASFPWETFIEAAGASNKAREKFVEVYNRARDELKNQRASHINSRLPDKEGDESSRSASGQGVLGRDVPTCRPERQPMEAHHQAGYWQFPGNAFNGGSKCNFQSFGMNVKTLNSNIAQKERFLSGQQGVNLVEGSTQTSQVEKAQTFQTVHGPGGRAGPTLETTQPGYAPSLAVKGPSLHMFSSHGEQLGTLPKALHVNHNDGLKRGPQLSLPEQSGVNSKVLQERVGFQKYDSSRNPKPRSDTGAWVALKELKPEGNMHRQDHSFIGNPALKLNYAEEALKLKEPTLSKGLAGVAATLDGSNDREDGLASFLGKRPRQVFEEVMVSDSGAGMVGKGSTERSERPSIRPHVWLQRWRPTFQNDRCTEGLTDSLSNIVAKDSTRCSIRGVATTKESAEYRLLDKTTEMKGSFVQKGTFVQRFEKEQGVEHIHVHTAKALPSAAAMAIVGTAARQFRSAQPQRRGSLAFWSGFGKSAVQKSGALKDQRNA